MRILTIMAGTLVAMAAVCPAAGQAVVEGAMVHANSAAATARVGSALGDALSKATGQNAEAMKSAVRPATSGKIEHVPQRSPSTSASRDSSQPFIVTSIRGAQKPCLATPTIAAAPQSEAQSAKPVAATAVAPAPPATTPVARTATPDCSGPAAAPAQSKSFINLSFPK
jgi:hypothetical protein